jgi:geranylgeranyl pyrophosphate synthase
MKLAPPPAPDLAGYLGELRVLVEEALARVCPADSPPMIDDAVRYALLGGGKRLRPCLTLAAAEALADRLAKSARDAHLLALPSACAVEMVHTYSLVHDDLPAMDDDALRRGRATTHVVYGDGLAILAGDGLLTEAFAVIAESPSRVIPAGAIEVAPGDRLRAITMLAGSAGMTGMVGGQAIDLAAAGQVRQRVDPITDLRGLENMHARKTGALIRAAATMGAIVTGADDSLVGVIDDYARELGLAFQIIDDVLDVEGSPAELGKTAGKDAASGKPTYPSLFGVEASRRLAIECVARAHAALAAAGIRGRLADIATWSLTRST